MATTKNILIAQRYSEALLQLAREGKVTYGKIGEDLALVRDTLNQSSDLAAFLVNPVMSADNKKEIVGKIFSSEIDKLILNFLFVLIEKDRFRVFSEVIESYNKALDDINNVQRISVSSAVDLTEDAKSRLKAKLEGKLRKSVAFDWTINPEIIAGLIIKMGDNVIDMSMKHKLEDLSKNIVK